MRLQQPDPATALLGLRAMKTLATTGGSMRPAQRAMLEAAKKVILHVDADIDALPAVTPAELAAGFPASELRQQFVNGMLVVALADGVPTRETVSKVEAFAEALGLATPEVTGLRRLAEEHMLLYKLDLLRRGHIADIFKNQLEQKGPLGLVKSVLTMRGMMEDRALAARYRAWEKLPEDTLGHHLVAFYNKNGFSVPGERSGFPEAGLYHDFCHLLGGYSIEPEGEIQVASFTAGFKHERPIYIVLFSVLIFSTGVNMRPTSDDFVTVGVLGKPGVAEKMFAAIERGSQVNQDLSDKWDYWAYVELPIDEVRRRLNILPKEAIG
jgi:ubiquinone biosynthesis protein Coq4